MLPSMPAVTPRSSADSAGSQLQSPQAAEIALKVERDSLDTPLQASACEATKMPANGVAISAVMDPPEPSAPGTPPTAPCEQSAGQYSADSGGFSSMSLSSRSNSMTVQTDICDGCSVFFARVPPTLQEDALLEVFEHYGPVQSINLYRRWAASKSSKGCGILTFKHQASADAAIRALHNKFYWKDGLSCMVVERVDLCKLQRGTVDRKRHSGSPVHRQCTDSPDSQYHKPRQAPTDVGQEHYIYTSEEWVVPNKCDKQHKQAQGDTRAAHQHWALQHKQQQQGMANDHSQEIYGGHRTDHISGTAYQQGAVAAARESPPPTLPGAGDSASYPYYYVPVGMPLQHCAPIEVAPQMTYYCPIAYPNMPQYMWVPYMPGAAYPAPEYVAPGPTLATDSVGAAGYSSTQWDSGAEGRSSSRLNSSDGSGGQVPLSPCIKDGNVWLSSGTGRHEKSQYNEAPCGEVPFVDCGEPALKAKQLTVCIKHCETQEALQSLVYHHLAELNHIHISAALGRLATIAAESGQYNRHRPPLQVQKFVVKLLDILVSKHLGNVKPFELCNSLSAAGKLGCRASADQIQQMTAAFINRLAVSKPGEVCMMLSAASRMGYRVTESQFEQMLLAVLGNLQECPLRRVQELLTTVERMGYNVSEEQLEQLRKSMGGIDCNLAVANSLTNLTLSSS